MSRAARAMVAGFAAGLAAGFTLWSREQFRHRRNLFSKRPFRRLAALGWLGGHPSPDTARVLREYIRWEPRADLRRRGRVLLARVERDLE